MTVLHSQILIITSVMVFTLREMPKESYKKREKCSIYVRLKYCTLEFYLIEIEPNQLK